MPYMTITNFSAGLDLRRSALTAPAGTLRSLKNLHLTPGGEIEKRLAFVNIATLPSNSVGLVEVNQQLYTYIPGGPSNTPPAGPYQVGTLGLDCTSIEQIVSQTLFDQQIFCVAFVDGGGTPKYFFNGAKITDPNVNGLYCRTYKTKIYTVAGPVMYFSAVGDPTTWTQGVNTLTLNPADKATQVTLSNGNLTAVATTGGAYGVRGAFAFGNGGNGKYYFEVKVVGTIAHCGIGVANLTSAMSGVNISSGTAFVYVDNGATLVNGVAGITVAVCANGDTLCVAVDVINNMIWYRTNGGNWNNNSSNNPSANVGGIDISAVTGSPYPFIFWNNAASPTVTANFGAASFAQAAPGGFSAVPASYGTGAGTIDLSLEDPDMSESMALEAYYDKLAVFSKTAVQTWQIDPDPLQSQFVQVLRQAGTMAPRSVLQYGSGDVLYVNQSGIRSLRARNASLAASVSDVGSPLDPVMQDLYRQNGQIWMSSIIAILQPVTGRFWIVLPDRIYILSEFPGPKITAWSEYDPGFHVTAIVTANQQIFLRDDQNQVWAYGGTDQQTYDDCPIEIVLPYHGGEQPATFKRFQGIDAAAEGVWDVYASLDPTTGAEDYCGKIIGPTFLQGSFHLEGVSTHISLRLRSSVTGPLILSNMVIHYELAQST